MTSFIQHRACRIYVQYILYKETGAEPEVVESISPSTKHATVQNMQYSHERASMQCRECRISVGYSSSN